MKYCRLCEPGMLSIWYMGGKNLTALEAVKLSCGQGEILSGARCQGSEQFYLMSVSGQIFLGSLQHERKPLQLGMADDTAKSRQALYILLRSLRDGPWPHERILAVV